MNHRLPPGSPGTTDPPRPLDDRYRQNPSFAITLPVVEHHDPLTDWHHPDVANEVGDQSAALLMPYVARPAYQSLLPVSGTVITASPVPATSNARPHG
jgi:hypothetical protein